MKKIFSLLTLAAALSFGLSSCIKDSTYPYGSNYPNGNLQSRQAVFSFSTSNNWEGSGRFENSPTNSDAQRGQISNYSSSDAVGLAAYQYLNNGELGTAVLEIDQSYASPISSGRTLYFDNPDRNPQALLTLGYQDNRGIIQDPWYSEAGQIYISRFSNYEIEGSFSARLFRNYNPNQVMQINNGQFYGRF